MPTVLGRPRSTAVDMAVARAVHDLLARDGYTALTIEGVAASANVGKATIYRRWGSKAEMVFALVVHSTDISPPSDLGTLEGDIRALATHVIALVSAPLARRALPGLLADLQSDPVLAERFQASFVDVQIQVVATLLERAISRGELSEGGPDACDVHALLLGMAFVWVFVLATPPPDLADRITQALLATLQE